MEPDRKIIKQYFFQNDVRYVIFKPNFLMIHYEKFGPKFKDEPELNMEEKHILSYLKKTGKSLARKEVNNWTDTEISNQSNLSSNPTNWTLIISLAVGGILIFGIIIFLLVRIKVKKTKC